MVRKEKQNRNIATSVVLGTLVGIVTSFFGILFVTLLVMSEKLAIAYVRYAVLVIMFAAALFGGTIASVYLKRNPLIVSLCVSGSLLLIMLSITAIFFEGRYSNVPVTLLTLLSSSFLIAIVRTKASRRPRYY